MEGNHESGAEDSYQQRAHLKKSNRRQNGTEIRDSEDIRDIDMTDIIDKTYEEILVDVLLNQIAVP